MKRISTLLFAAAVLSTMGYGVASATAQPGRAKAEGICPFARDSESCTDCCGAYGMAGYYSGGTCGCI
ncbi:hypothetical protein [Longimicrobium sp.]|uniref:hypothetical protein n=1 Tax=Longimicrobium sp. TaxID=2029185 RepID=UPI002E326C7A|nr:hypothetical protein [Longimicrobium sp.]HEX6040069.1 hypothetical protein [Longimicrobium sp.]